MQTEDLNKHSQANQQGLLNPKLRRLFPKSVSKQSEHGDLNKLVALFKAGEHDRCLALGLQLTHQHPENGLFWKVLGTVQQNLADNENAIASLNRANELLTNDADVFYNLGNAYFDLEQLESARVAYESAIVINQSFDKAYYNLANVYTSLDKFDEAEAAYRQAISINPDEVQPYLKLAGLLDESGRVDEAIRLLSQITQTNHDTHELYLSLAIELDKNNQLEDAKAAYEKALQLAPDNIDLYNNYGLFLQRQNAFQQAEQIYLEGFKHADANAEILCSIGSLYYEIARLDQAEYCLKKAMLSFPDNSLPFINYALFLFNTGKVFDAVAYGKKALEIEEDNVAALNNLGLAYYSCGKFEESRAQFEKVVEVDPDNLAARSNISLPLKRLGLLSEAEKHIRHGLSINPEAHDLVINLASILQAQGKIIEASEVNKKAIALKPERLMAYHNILFDMCYSSSFSREEIMNQLKAYGAMATKVATMQFNRWHEKQLGEKLRIGFVSADYILHPVTTFLTTVLKQFDLSTFELHAYSNNPKEDVITQSIKPFFKSWNNIVGMNDEAAARKIHADGIDILIDLSGHTGGTRLPMFAYKPAPVQATWLGYWASSGIEQMDYILLDEVSAPTAIQDQFTEKVAYLPVSRFCYSPPEEKLDISPLPALRKGHVTLGCYHNYSKVTDEVVALWCGCMLASEDLTLRWITSAFKDEKIVHEVKERFLQHGIESSRLELIASLPREEYLASFNEIDMMIDAFPFTSCTTASDGLWMGVPTIAMSGNSLVARQSTSLMYAVDLPDWVAHDTESYIEKVLAFSSDLDQLSAIRSSMRSRMLASPLADASSFTRNLESSLKRIWQEYLEQKTELQPNTFFKHVNSESHATSTVVIATTKPEAEFWSQTATGISLKKLEKLGVPFSYHIAFANRRGLPEIYNKVIDEAPNESQLVFIHDDVWFDQFDIFDAINEGLQQFDIIGVAGNTRRAQKHANWLFVAPNQQDEARFLSGKVACGEVPNGLLNVFGPSGQACESLDGVLLAASSTALKASTARFDTQYMFHFYDMDFCRSAREASLRLGTWDLNITHQSPGDFDSKWYEGYKQYLAKWEPEATPDPFTDVNQELNDSISEVLKIATQLQEQGGYQEAADLYQEVLAIDAKHPEAKHQLGRMQFLTQQFDAALENLLDAVRLEQDNPQFWVSYIDSLIETEQFEQAKRVINAASSVNISPELLETLLASCEVHTLNDQPEAVGDILALEAALAADHPRQDQMMERPIKWHDAPTSKQVDFFVAPELLKAVPQSLMIEYTSRCNLRCKYCSKSNPGDDQIPGRNMDMTPETVDAVLDLVNANHFAELLLAGTGESTFHPEWKADFPRIIEVAKAKNPNCYVHVNTNFAMKYEDEDWAAFAQLDGVVISIDTADRELTKQVRAKSDLGLIIYNITRFSTYCQLHGLKLPRLTINITLYQEAAEGLPELMVMLASLPISSVSISDMFERAATDKHAIRPLNHDNSEAFIQAVASIQQAIDIANQQQKFSLSVQPHLLARIEKMIGDINAKPPLSADENQTNGMVSVAGGATMTRMCLQPWSRFTIGADAAIFPCCVTEMDPTGTIGTDSVEDGIDGNLIQQFRQALLTGNVPTPCVNCTNATDCNTDQLVDAVRNLSPAH